MQERGGPVRLFTCIHQRPLRNDFLITALCLNSYVFTSSRWQRSLASNLLLIIGFLIVGRNYCSPCLREVSIFILLLSWKLDSHDIRSWASMVRRRTVSHYYLRRKWVSSIPCIDLIVPWHWHCAIVNRLWNTTCCHHSISPATVIASLAMRDWDRSCHHVQELHFGVCTTTPFFLNFSLVYGQGVSPMVDHWWQVPLLLFREEVVIRLTHNSRLLDWADNFSWWIVLIQSRGWLFFVHNFNIGVPIVPQSRCTFIFIVRLFFTDDRVGPLSTAFRFINGWIHVLWGI